VVGGAVLALGEASVFELLEEARSRVVAYRGAWDGGDALAPGDRDYRLAEEAIESAQMRFARGFARDGGRFAPVDVERS
jgi:hypothetical protein